MNIGSLVRFDEDSVVHGWRVYTTWPSEGRPPLLCGGFYVAWPSATMEARCFAYGSPCPGRGGEGFLGHDEHGVHAMVSRTRLDSHGFGRTIVARVELSGWVATHMYGFRAQRCRILSIGWPARGVPMLATPREAAAVAESYGVDYPFGLSS